MLIWIESIYTVLFGGRCVLKVCIFISWGDRNWVNYAKKRRPNEPCGTARVEWNPIASQNPIRSEYKQGDF